MLRSILSALVLVTHVFAATSGCALTSVTGTGLNVTFYHYPLIGTKDVDPKYNVTTYADYGEAGSTSGVTAVNYNGGGGTYDTPYYGLIYGFNITTSNFSMKLTGYFLARQTGTYSFSIVGDDSIGLSIGSSGSCCGSVTDVVDSSEITVASGQRQTVNATLTAGLYYPVQLLYLNVRGGSVVNVKYTEPDGTAVSDFGSDVYQISQAQECYTTTTTYWTGTETSTTTATGSETQTVIVLLPPDRTSTYWTNSYTSTTTYTPSDGGKPTVYLELPPAYTTSTWPESYTSTTTIMPTDGGQPTVKVNVPGPSTSTSTWPNDYTTTSTITGPNGETPVVYVPGPSSSISISTSTSTWPNTYTTTSTITGPNGETPVVYVPGPSSSTKFPMNTGGWNSTYTPLSPLSSSSDPISPEVSPMTSPTESPVSSLTESPVSSPTESPVSSPTESPVSSPTMTSPTTWPNPPQDETRTSPTTWPNPPQDETRTSPTTTPNPTPLIPDYVTEVTTCTTTDTEVPGVTVKRTFTTTRTVCTKCEGSPVETEHSPAKTDDDPVKTQYSPATTNTRSSPTSTTTETKTVVTTSTDANGDMVVLTMTITTTYCPTTDSSPAGQPMTLLTTTSCASCVGGVPGSTSVPGATMTTYDGGSPNLAVVSSMAILPLLALFI